MQKTGFSEERDKKGAALKKESVVFAAQAAVTKFQVQIQFRFKLLIFTAFFFFGRSWRNLIFFFYVCTKGPLCILAIERVLADRPIFWRFPSHVISVCLEFEVAVAANACCKLPISTSWQCKTFLNFPAFLPCHRPSWTHRLSPGLRLHPIRVGRSAMVYGRCYCYYC